MRASPKTNANSLSIGTRKTGVDGNLWKVVEDIHGRHTWIMSRNKTYRQYDSDDERYTLQRTVQRPKKSVSKSSSKVKTNSKSKSKSKTKKKDVSKSKVKAKTKSKSKTKSKVTRLDKSKTKVGAKSKSKSISKGERKGPSQSATLYKVGTKKIGNDGNRWIIAQSSNGVKRWTLYKKLTNKDIDNSD